MFKINYRITDSTEDLLSLSQQELDECYIEGYIEIVVNDKKYGYYKKEPITVGEGGLDLLTTWFEGLVDVLIKLKQKHQYIALYAMDTYETWLEFKRLDINSLNVSIINFRSNDGTGQIITEAPFDARPSDWANEIISYNELRNEVLLKVNQYINELVVINKLFASSKRLMRLKDLINDT